MIITNVSDSNMEFHFIYHSKNFCDVKNPNGCLVYHVISIEMSSALISSTHILGFHMSSHSKNAINNAILILTLTFHIFDYNKYQIELQK